MNTRPKIGLRPAWMDKDKNRRGFAQKVDPGPPGLPAGLGEVLAGDTNLHGVQSGGANKNRAAEWAARGGGGKCVNGGKPNSRKL